MKIKLTKKLFIISTLFVLFLLMSACSADLSVLTNSVSGRTAQQGGGSMTWIDVNDTLGHKWLLEYDHPSQTATLRVAIVRYDQERYELTDIIYDNCEYKIGGKVDQPNKGDILFDLDIKSAIINCYDAAKAANLIPSVPSVPDVEYYQKIQFEIVGGFDDEANGMLFKYGNLKQQQLNYTYSILNPSKNKGSLELWATGGAGDIAGKSNAFDLNSAQKDFRGASNLDFWESIHQNPRKGELSYLEHFIWSASTAKVGTTEKQSMGPINAVRMDITKNQFVVSPVKGFNLEKIFVDPKNFGGGGGFG